MAPRRSSAATSAGKTRPDREQLKTVRQIERYSDEYFAFSRKYGKEAAKYFALEGKVVIVLGDQAYEF